MARAAPTAPRAEARYGGWCSGPSLRLSPGVRPRMATAVAAQISAPAALPPITQLAIVISAPTTRTTSTGACGVAEAGVVGAEVAV